ncbi:hypothetical protein D5018_10280 [Parashewanella curva]|uniref:Uncharacterized protein n=1 Tax=Parashewanella curva TaxID=2338552 RepID=A0A3L8PZ06_9GAMM|nr:hypothetical protein [Parashewanella curva]RLV59748.1 hypothetical protein D5018_10280 [Parashewanella curva]
MSLTPYYLNEHQDRYLDALALLSLKTNPRADFYISPLSPKNLTYRITIIDQQVELVHLIRKTDSAYEWPCIASEGGIARDIKTRLTVKLSSLQRPTIVDRFFNNKDYSWELQHLNRCSEVLELTQTSLLTQTSSQWFDKVKQPASSNEALVAAFNFNVAFHSREPCSRLYDCHCVEDSQGQLFGYADPAVFQFMFRLKKLGHRVIILCSSSLNYDFAQRLFSRYNIELKSNNLMDLNYMQHEGLKNIPELIEHLGFTDNMLLFDADQKHFSKCCHFYWVNNKTSFPIHLLPQLPKSIEQWIKCANEEPSATNPLLTLVVNLNTLFAHDKKRGRFTVRRLHYNMGIYTPYIDLDAIQQLKVFIAKGHRLHIFCTDYPRTKASAVNALLSRLGLKLPPVCVRQLCSNKIAPKHVTSELEKIISGKDTLYLDSNSNYNPLRTEFEKQLNPFLNYFFRVCDSNNFLKIYKLQ